MPSVANLFQGNVRKWNPDADAVNAPEGSLLRCDNLVPDKNGALSLRRGSSQIYTDMGTDVNSLYTTELNDGTTYRACGVDDSIWINGELKQSNVDGSGDIAMGDDAYQMFFARGTTKKKWDPTENSGTGAWENWGLEKPSGKVTLAASTNVTVTAADFNNSESPACTVLLGTGTIGGAADQVAAANEATEVTPNVGKDKSVVQRLWTTDQDFFDVSSVPGSETDMIDVYVKIEKVTDLTKIRLMFGCGDSSTVPFKEDRFQFTLEVNKGLTIPIKDSKSEGYSAYDQAVIKSVSAVDPTARTGIQSPEQVKASTKKIGDTHSPKIGPPPDDTWGHITVTRGQFKRIGNKTTRGWDTIRGFRAVAEYKKGKSTKVTWSDCKIIGGGDRCLTGTFRCVIRAVRDHGEYFEMSPPSEQSDAVVLNHETLQVTIPNATHISLDSQADQIWVYLFGGWLSAYYRFAVSAAQPSTGLTVDELTTPDGSDFDDADERSRLVNHGMTLQAAAGSADIVMTLETSEMSALTQNIRLEPYTMGPPDNIIDIAGPWLNRTFCLTSEGYLYMSLNITPSSFNSIQFIDLRRYGDPLWIVKTGNGIYVGMEKDVVFIAGDGQETPDGAYINLWGQPLNVGNPPIDSCHWVDGNTIVYRSNDGLMVLTGGQLEPFPLEGTGLLWRGVDRHGILGLNTTTGRFRCTIDNHIFYLLVAEGTETESQTVYRYSFPDSQWSRLEFQQAGNWRSIYNDPDGALIAGDDEGVLWLLETGTQDNGEDIPVNVLTPIEDGGQPLESKDAFDLQLHLDTGDTEGNAYLYKDGSVTAADVTLQPTSDGPGIWRGTASALGTFFKAQLLITGDFSTFTLNSFNLTYRPRPQRMTYLDTGYLISGGDLVWVHEIEIDGIFTGDATVQLFFNDVQSGDDIALTVTPDKRDVYQLTVPRGSKGERPRVVIKDDAPTGTDNGFDCYQVRIRRDNSGNEDMNRVYETLYPTGQKQ